MKEIILTQGKVALVDDADFEWLNQWKWYSYKSRNTYYATRRFWLKDEQKYLGIKMHRLILGLSDPKIFCDHKDHNGLNNQRNNLRVVNYSQNTANSNSRIGSKSKYLGVYYYEKQYKGKTYKYWAAQVMKDRKQNFLGHFTTEDDAAIAYNKAAEKLHGEFANLNQV